jgi:cold shock CspA family protein
MGTETGYVSSFDEWEGFGFIRPADDPAHLVKFRQGAVDAGAVTGLRAGLQVSYELAPASESVTDERWPVATSVTIERPAPGEVDATQAEADEL